MRFPTLSVLGCFAIGCALGGCGDDDETTSTATTTSSSASSATGGGEGGNGGSGGLAGGGGSGGGPSGGAGGTGGTATGGGGAGGSGTGGAGGTGTGGAGGTGTGGGGGGASALNGCDPAAATDLTAQNTVDIAFGGGIGFTYDPPCVVIKAGTTLTYNGSFALHPLNGGTVNGAVATPDPQSPITMTSAGTTASFVMSSPGDYGFYCGIHYAIGMKGAAFVVP